MKIIRSEEWLNNYSKLHLLYELKMFWWLAQVVTLHDGPLRYALLESFVLHLRNLICFFCPQSRHTTDVIAANFFDNPADWGQSATLNLRNAHKRANKEMHHLTDERKEDGDVTKGWNIPELFNEVMKLAEEFSDKASQKKLNAEVRQFLSVRAKTGIIVGGAANRTQSTTGNI
jgi:hypothetical protein